MDHLMADQDSRGRTEQPAGKAAAGAAYGDGTNLSQGADPGGEDASAGTDQQQQHDGEEAQPLTATIAMGLNSMEDRRQQLHAMVGAHAGLAGWTCVLCQLEQ